ncbi:glycosyltransferase family 2 protein [Paenibacillus sp. JDR-2]|uniref:tetratricopeptide repeat-containing glycosyltransferase family 2 protein n=1 Tax=Paenibacillus sp. (strain JDR-2) TaxID=324057 RepID=UPI0001667D04|nr:glycosyltransferase family 2 protein [Paenibacillus sp. JDR-2]ACT04364.1 glycosyl transferase family 2 [Paenibacillus sp. JDR-2]
MKISACLITKNEEANIRRCIDSFKEIVNEIILVDTGSTDNTVEIAKELGAKVFFFEWNNSFADARNYALDQASSEWIVFLDADEFFYKDTAKTIPPVLQKINNNKNIDALLLKHLSIDGREEKVIQTNSLVRVFRGNTNIRYKGNIHESVFKEGDTVKLFNSTNLDLKIYHTGYSGEIISTKAERNLELLLIELANNSKNKLNYLYLSDCYITLGQYDDAIKYGQMFIESGASAVGLNSKPYHNIIRSMKQLGYSYEEKKRTIFKAIDRFPSHPDFYKYLAVEYFNNKEYIRALEAFNKVIELQSKYKDIELNTIPGLLTDIYYYMGILYEYKNDAGSAFDHYFNSLSENKYNENSFYSLINLIKKENPEDIILLLNRIYHKSVEEDVRFLVTKLSTVKLGKVLLFYWKIWNSQYRYEDSTLMFALLSNGNYEAAYSCFYKCYLEERTDWTALFTVVSSILSNSTIEVDQTEDFPISYKKIILLYTGQATDQILLKEELLVYMNLITEMILLDNRQVVNALLNLKSNFEIDISTAIGSTLMDYRIYDLAIEHFAEALDNTSEDMQKSKLYFNIGYCHFKLVNYSLAKESFMMAQRHGYNANNVYDYMTWVNNLIK